MHRPGKLNEVAEAYHRQLGELRQEG